MEERRKTNRRVRFPRRFEMDESPHAEIGTMYVIRDILHKFPTLWSECDLSEVQRLLNSAHGWSNEKVNRRKAERRCQRKGIVSYHGPQ